MSNNFYYSIHTFILLSLLLVLFQLDSIHAVKTSLKDYSTAEADIERAVNLAIEELQLNSKEYQTTLETYGMSYDLVSKCAPSNSYSWPKTLNLSNNTLVACSENVVGAPWVISSSSGFYFKLSQLLQEALQKQYPGLTIRTLTIDASRGYFPSLRDAVNSGACHMVISSTAVNTEREKEANFGCSHSAANRAILRGELDSEKVLDSLAKFNDTSVKVAILKGSAWESLIQPYFPLATVSYAGSFDDCMNLVKTQEAHVSLLHDVVVNYWKPSNCPECKVYPFGDDLQFGVFFKKGVTNSTTRFTASWINIVVVTLIGLFVANRNF